MENTQSLFGDTTQSEGDSVTTAKIKSSPPPTPSALAQPASRSAPDSSVIGAGASSEVDDGEDDPEVLMMEHLFDKVLTPGDMVDPSTNSYDRLTTVGPQRQQNPDDGLVFEDRAVAGKLWRFQSDWRSSEVHALCPTDGWALFAREKGLAPGDAVSFYRGNDNGRLFVDCSKRRGDRAPCPRGVFAWAPVAAATAAAAERPQVGADEAPRAAARRGTLPRRSPAVPRRPRRSKGKREEDDLDEAAMKPPTILESMPPLVPSPDPKRVRLFGIYLN
ncbi:putative B3 domain-containing protein Os02g0455900 [Brachypodium distachyon]|uniref:TF-B3 domain-containing protein n=1 Tax=Brachypodium distachyon TaxID=15368 RepID=A0A2K2CWK2_BRADI|nr:putative B3 domain-containing protein Os02g0455900 [Brachypodium distachyon]PNT66408.1 hypothetical protein BRADI_3g11145v3 [Brachypodium distachyon]|eukprot:XP_010236374.1 putative B3 domain-containing protein Os02g0455900 [Brachypodium distachyon]